ncbi:MAG: H+-translocating transhydrogenase subunit alpha [Solirubrobacteraceae bacterium]|jgi:NAD(P) transhydrogenase subunit alpha|nr:H+-translocating transhydrogenase subunit alpha [Solirubrobacteraceae bacterium]
MKVGVPKETGQGESRVALVPEVVRKLTAKDFEVVVQSGAGEGSMLADAVYEDAGASISDDVWTADVVVKVAPPSDEEIAKLGKDTVLIGFLGPLSNPQTTTSLAEAGATSFAMEAIPRISRAQSMDALSSQSNVAGYKSVLVATNHFGRFLPMMMTAAGTVPPAKVLVLGAGVAGLQAIATARRLGAQVTGYDVRAAVAEQVKSLGAAFLELEAGKGAEGEGGYARELTDEEKAAQQQELTDKIGTFDIVITTALVPGRPAPRLVSAEAVEKMKAGSVIVDLAGETGGNCELTEPGETVVKHDVTIMSPLNLASEMAEHSSSLYARNVQSLLELLVDEDGALHLNFDDEIISGACITREGEVVHAGAKKAVEAAGGGPAAPAAPAGDPEPSVEAAPDDGAPAELVAQADDAAADEPADESATSADKRNAE